MTIIGLGSDIVDIRRIEKLLEKFGSKFEERIFNQEERSVKNASSHYAKRFAAKEAFSKALGTGIGKNLSFKDLTITNLPSGKPTISVTGDGAVQLRKITPKSMSYQIDVSLSDEYPIAYAVVIISATDP